MIHELSLLALLLCAASQDAVRTTEMRTRDRGEFEPASSTPAEGVVPAERIERRLAAMGTDLTVRVEAGTRAAALRASERAVRAIEVCEGRLSTWRDDSELTRLNQSPVGEPFALSAELAAVLARAWTLSEETGGAFDPSLGALVHAWGLRTGGRQPEEGELERARATVGLTGLELDGRRAVRRAAVVLEEGAFGKGAGLDAALAALVEHGATAGDLDLGGQQLVFGGPVTIGVAHPTSRDRVVLTTVVESGSVATTGNSERAIVVDGERRSHVLDPRSGEPAADWGSVTVHAPDGLTADALSTGLFVLGPEAALAYAEAHEGIEVLTLEFAQDEADGRELVARASAGWNTLQRTDEALHWQEETVLGSR